MKTFLKNIKVYENVLSEKSFILDLNEHQLLKFEKNQLICMKDCPFTNISFLSASNVLTIVGWSNEKDENEKKLYELDVHQWIAYTPSLKDRITENKFSTTLSTALLNALSNSPVFLNHLADDSPAISLPLLVYPQGNLQLTFRGQKLPQVVLAEGSLICTNDLPPHSFLTLDSYLLESLKIRADEQSLPWETLTASAITTFPQAYRFVATVGTARLHCSVCSLHENHQYTKQTYEIPIRFYRDDSPATMKTFDIQLPF